MLRYFECLHCGTVTPLEGLPVKCPSCGHGTGVLHEQDPREKMPGENGAEDGHSGKPGDPSGG